MSRWLSDDEYIASGEGPEERKKIARSTRKCLLRPSANERQKTRNTKENGLAHPRFIVCVTPKINKIKKHCFAKRYFGNQTVFDSKNMFSSEHVRNKDQCLCFSLSTRGIADLSVMFCLLCALCQNSLFRDAKPARHLFL